MCGKQRGMRLERSTGEDHTDKEVVKEAGYVLKWWGAWVDFYV